MIVPSRMLIRLTELGLTRRLTWAEVADIQADHQADVEVAVAEALEWERSLTRADEVELLAVRLARFRKLLDGSEHSLGYHRAIARENLARIVREDREQNPRTPQGLAEFSEQPSDFCRPGDVRDVDPATMPDLPALGAVA